jgi:glycine hydroxymethyltransferase
MKFLPKDDPELAELIKKEQCRVENTLDLIAAENHPPRSIMEALGSIFTTKTIEGYPGHRFHAGCQYADEVENLAILRGKRLFGSEYVNVQPHSGTSANLAVYFSVLQVGDRILAMSLPHGGHLSHGHRASITSKCFEFKHYGVNAETELIDYGKVRDLARKFKPKMIVAGASSYARLIDYQEMSAIARDISAYLLVDMAHIAGLVAAKVIPSPVPHSDFVTFTCYKTMMGGRGGVILARQQYGDKINSAIFPGSQGTSAVNLIAAKAVIFKLAMEQSFVDLQRQTLQNAAQFASQFDKKGYRIVAGGTDTHQVLVDLTASGLAGNTAEKLLESVGIILNRNVIPRDAEHPGRTSGIRLGSAAISSRRMGNKEVVRITDLMDATMRHHEEKEILAQVSSEVSKLCEEFPVYTPM